MADESPERFEEEWGNDANATEDVIETDAVQGEKEGEEYDPYTSGPAFGIDSDDDEPRMKKKIPVTQKVQEKTISRKEFSAVDDEEAHGNDKNREIPIHRRKYAGNEVNAADSEDDQEGARTAEDRQFIDDEGAELAGESDDEHAVIDAPQAEEEDDELEKIFKRGKRRNNKLKAEMKELIVEETMAMMEKACKQDAELNRQGKPAIQKLKLISKVKQALAKKDLHSDFLDGGILSQLKNWLEPLPNGSLPNIKVRTGVLEALVGIPIDLEDDTRKQQLKLSGLGKVIMFLSKYTEETAANRKLAKELMDAWSRPLFNKSTRYEDLKMYNQARVETQPATGEERKRKSSELNIDNSMELDLDSKAKVSDSDRGRQRARIPQQRSLDFVLRPQSKVSEGAVDKNKNKMSAKQEKMSKRMQQMISAKRKNLRAEKVSVEGRGLTKFI